MSATSILRVNRFRIAFLASVCLLAPIILASAGCASKHTEPSSRFHLHGKVVSVNLTGGYAEIDHDAIPRYMEAMTMSYRVPDTRVLASLKAGEEITADVVVVNNLAHLENIVIVKRARIPRLTEESGQPIDIGVARKARTMQQVNGAPGET